MNYNKNHLLKLHNHLEVYLYHYVKFSNENHGISSFFSFDCFTKEISYKKVPKIQI